MVKMEIKVKMVLDKLQDQIKNPAAAGFFVHCD